VAARQGKLDLAALLLERALKFDPVNARAFNNLGAVMSRKHDLAAAERLASRAVELEPDYLSALINLARYRALLGMSTSAVETLEHARALDRTGEHARELNEVQALLRK
jgi:Flp pilus assembly protein TadD